MNLGFTIAIIAVWIIPVILIFRMVRLVIKMRHPIRENIVQEEGMRLPDALPDLQDMTYWDQKLRDLELYVFIEEGRAYDNELLSPFFMSWSTYSKGE